MSGKGDGWEESEPSGRYTKSAKKVEGWKSAGGDGGGYQEGCRMGGR